MKIQSPKIYKRGLIFGDFNFGGLSKITKIGQNYILAPQKTSYTVYFGVLICIKLWDSRLLGQFANLKEL